jgi:uncharacterized protein (DUF2141 family)
MPDCVGPGGPAEVVVVAVLVSVLVLVGSVVVGTSVTVTVVGNNVDSGIVCVVLYAARQYWYLSSKAQSSEVALRDGFL